MVQILDTLELKDNDKLPHKIKDTIQYLHYILSSYNKQGFHVKKVN